MGSAFRSARRGIASNETPPSRPLRSTTAAALFNRLEGRLRGDALPGQGPKHVCVFPALGDAAARDVWFFGHEDERFGENVAIAPGARRDRGGRCRESDGIDATRGAAGVRRSPASRLRRLFRAAIHGDPQVKNRCHYETHERHEAEEVDPLNSRKPRKIRATASKGLSKAFAPYAPTGGNALSWPRRGAGDTRTGKTWETWNLVSVASVTSCFNPAGEQEPTEGTEGSAIRAHGCSFVVEPDLGGLNRQAEKPSDVSSLICALREICGQLRRVPDESLDGATVARFAARLAP